MLEDQKVACVEQGLKINWKKSKCMILSGQQIRANVKVGINRTGEIVQISTRYNK